MNSIFLSPHFPNNFRYFVNRLKNAGTKVFGLSDEPYEYLHPELKESLHDYYRVNNMHNYDELVRALGYFTHKYGKIDHIDSQNEYWLETEARLRTDFNIVGIRSEDLNKIKSKTEMKKIFQKSGLKVARGQICKSEEEFRNFVKTINYPVVAKPDIGVGAAKTFKIESENELNLYLKEKLDCDYIVEEFINGQIVSFDGLVDKNGNLIFYSSLRYSKGVMEVVNENSDMYYYITRNIEEELKEAGMKLLEAYELKSRFFHFEFFLEKNGKFSPLEVNMRPPGGLTLDMFNYAFDFDCYKLWAELVSGHKALNNFSQRKYYVMYVGRKYGFNYILDHNNIISKYDNMIVQNEEIDPVFAPAIGNYGYVLRHEDKEPLISAAIEIQERIL